MVTVASLEVMIRECSMYEEHLSAQLADAERDAPHSVTGLIELVDVVRELKAELIAAHRRDERATPAQREALFGILSGQNSAGASCTAS